MFEIWVGVIFIVVVFVIVLILIFTTTTSGATKTFYYQYPNSQVITLGDLGSDPVLDSIRLFNLYKTAELNSGDQVGVMQTEAQYTAFPLNNVMFLNKILSVKLNNQDMYFMLSLMQYTSDPPAKPTNYTFEDSFIISSTDKKYIGSRFSIQNVKDDIYRLTIGQ